ncbi:PilZ domain-containing protein [Chitinimonas lacunae]|uniref:PilZ domain-containing protein n=1 Tax=Chitinimonas lacunae TaxID=1963018 RepID=A0ABV8MV35_9NEIS
MGMAGTPLFNRIRYKTWVKVILDQGAGLLGNIEDISATTLGMELDKPVSPGGMGTIYFMLPLDGQEHIIQARCRIAACQPAVTPKRFHIELALLDLDRSTTRLIDAFVHFLTGHPESRR